MTEDAIETGHTPTDEEELTFQPLAKAAGRLIGKLDRLREQPCGADTAKKILDTMEASRNSNHAQSRPGGRRSA